MTSPVISQPSQDMPQRVFGTVENLQGEYVADIQVEITFNGETIASDSTDEGGYYDIQIPFKEEYNQLDIHVSGSQKDSFEFESGKVVEKEILIEESTPSQGSSGGGGGGGLAGLQNTTDVEEPQNPSNTTETTENNTEETGQKDSKPDEVDNEEITETGKEEGKEKIVKEVKEGEMIRVDMEEESSGRDSSVSVSFESGESASSASVQVNEMSVKEFTEEKGDEIANPENSEVYSYLEIDTNVSAKNAEIKFTVNKSYIREKDASKADVKQQRYAGGEWQKLETTYVEEKEGSYVYSSSSPEGFSNFAITIEEETENNNITGEFISGKTSIPVLIVLSLIITGILVLRKIGGQEKNLTGLEEFA